MAFLEDPPEVYPDWIYFTKKKLDCDYYLPLSSGTYLFKGTRVTICGLKDLGGFMSVAIEYTDRRDIGWPLKRETMAVSLKKSQAGRCDETFNKVFSKEPVPLTASPGPLETVSDLIKYLGYPIYQCQENDVTMFYYNEFYASHGAIGGHTAWFIIKDGKVVGWRGEI